MSLMSKSISNPTTVQSLGPLLKSARDIMRKDKGRNGDLDRLPMLTWIMFLKYLDDMELQREEPGGPSGRMRSEGDSLDMRKASGKPRSPTPTGNFQSNLTAICPT